MVGGYDDSVFPTRFYDTDLCLRLRAAGRAVVVIPHARIRDNGPSEPAESSTRPLARRQLAALRTRWGHELARDPFYNPGLALDEPLWSGLAAPPRERRLRFSE